IRVFSPPPKDCRRIIVATNIAETSLTVDGVVMNKSRQRFWELTGSKLGNILGVEKTAEQIDADTAVVGEDGEVDFKGEAKFQQHLTKGEAPYEFSY
ncbi:hypothetical protein Tco_1064532, partial [Tanacetum coccineum]